MKNMQKKKLTQSYQLLTKHCQMVADGNFEIFSFSAYFSSSFLF